MLQNDGEPACQGKTYNALKDKKHLTGINKEVLSHGDPGKIGGNAVVWDGPNQ